MTCQSVDDQTRDLLQLVELLDVDLIKLSGVLDETADDEIILSFDGDLEPQFSLAIDSSDNPKKARFRLGLELTLPFAEIEVEAGAVYDLGTAELDDLETPVLQNFINKVVVMTLVPYLRAEVTSLTSKLFRMPITLPILAPGEVSFQVAKAD